VSAQKPWRRKLHRVLAHNYEIQHDWFAWHPVRLDTGRLVWLRCVSRWKLHPLSDWDYWIVDAIATTKQEPQ